MNMPSVTVLMSVHNGEQFLAEAIESVLRQTWRDFEFIIINDGSIDGTADILTEFGKKDPRIIIVEHADSAGLTARLNQGLRLARGALVARMDADDIALPERLALQKAFLDTHPQVAAVGGSLVYIDEHGVSIGEYAYPCTAEGIQEQLLFYGSPIAHPAAMFRLESVLAVGGYREIFTHAQDYDLWLRLAKKSGLSNLPVPVLHYRHHADSTNKKHTISQLICMALARLSARQSMLCLPDFLAERKTPVDMSLFRRHLNDFDVTTLGQLICAVFATDQDPERDAFAMDCWKVLLSASPVNDREQRALITAYRHAVIHCPNRLLEIYQEWESSPYRDLHYDILVKFALTLPLPPFDKLEKALGGHIVADNLLARELVWQFNRGESAPPWLRDALEQEVAAVRGADESDFGWLHSRYGCISLLIRQCLAGWFGALVPQADISQAGPTASLALLCRLCATIHNWMGKDTSEVILAKLGQWLLTEVENPQGRDVGFLLGLARLGDSADFLQAVRRLAECGSAEEQGFSVIVEAGVSTDWLFYLSNVLAHTPNVEMILCDLSPDFAMYFCEQDYAVRHPITVIASSKGAFASKNEALTCCRYPVIAFAKDFFCYDVQSLRLAAGHLCNAAAVWGQPHFAQQLPDKVRHELAFGAVPCEVEKYFPLFIRRDAVNTLGFFSNDTSERISEKKYRERMAERGIAVAYAEDVFITHGTPPAQSSRSRMMGKSKALLRDIMQFCKRILSGKGTACVTARAPAPSTAPASEMAHTPVGHTLPLDDIYIATFEEWLQLFPGYGAPLLVSSGVDLALRRAGVNGKMEYGVLLPPDVPTAGGRLLLVLFAQEVEAWPREFLAAHCTVLLYDGPPEEVYATRARAYDIADLCVALTEESRVRLAMLHPAVCEANSPLTALVLAQKMYRADELCVRYTVPGLRALHTGLEQADTPRILLMVDTFYTGGRESVILTLMPYLRDRGYNVTLGIARDSTPEGRAMLGQAGLEFFNFPDDVASQQKLLLERKIDLVAAQHCKDGVLAAGMAGISCIQAIYGMFLQAEKAELEEWKKLDAYTSTYSCVSALSAMCVDCYLGVDVNKIIITPCASSMQLPTGFSSREEDVALRAELGIPDNSPVFIYPARLQDAKGQGILLDAFAQAFLQDSRIRLILLGPCFDSVYKAYLQGLIANYGLDHAVILAGHRDDLPRFFNLGRALVMPSFTEGWSLAIAEAVQVGLPVIATDVGGAAEQLRGTDGILLPAFADDLWRMTPARIGYAVQHEHQQHRVRYALSKALLAMASRPFGSQSLPQATSVVSTEEACARQLQIFASVLDKLPVSALRNGTFIPQKQSKYIEMEPECTNTFVGNGK